MSNYHIDGENLLGITVVLGEVARLEGIDDADILYWADRYWRILCSLMGEDATVEGLASMRETLKAGF